MASRTEMAATWPPTAVVATAAGHSPMSPLEAIRRKCRDCSCYQPSEVRLCEAVNCPLWPFRAGVHPYTAARLKTGPQEASFAGEGIVTVLTLSRDEDDGPRSNGAP